jgi:hypothetical protein
VHTTELLTYSVVRLLRTLRLPTGLTTDDQMDVVRCKARNSPLCHGIGMAEDVVPCPLSLCCVSLRAGAGAWRGVAERRDLVVVVVVDVASKEEAHAVHISHVGTLTRCAPAQAAGEGERRRRPCTHACALHHYQTAAVRAACRRRSVVRCTEDTGKQDVDVDDDDDATSRNTCTVRSHY